MSDEHSSSLRRASAAYRDLAGKLRELARACVVPGSRRDLLRLAGLARSRSDPLRMSGYGGDSIALWVVQAERPVSSRRKVGSALLLYSGERRRRRCLSRGGAALRRA